MLLLEIGLWQLITKKLADDDKQRPEKKHTDIIERDVPLLGSYTGVHYQNAVHYCLQTGNNIIPRGIEDTNKATIAAYLSFQKHVVDELAMCSA